MAFFQVRTTPSAAQSKDRYHIDPRIRALDELQRMSADHRDKFLGPSWFPEARDFYNILGSGMRAPSFRPRIMIPQLQVIAISEATELSDASPKVYIYDRGTGKVDEERGRVFDEQWRRAFVNYEMMHAILWAMVSTIGWIQTGYDPTADYGLGEVWAKNRDPETVYPDPGAMSDDDWQYVAFEDRLYPQQIRALHPETGRGIEAEPYMPGSFHSPEGFGFKLPEGPMSVTSGPVGGEQHSGDARARVRLFIPNR